MREHGTELPTEAGCRILPRDPDGGRAAGRRPAGHGNPSRVATVRRTIHSRLHLDDDTTSDDRHAGAARRGTRTTLLWHGSCCAVPPGQNLDNALKGIPPTRRIEMPACRRAAFVTAITSSSLSVLPPPAAAADLYVLGPKAVRSRSHRPRARTNGLAFDGGGQIAGTVTDAATGLPLAGSTCGC